MHGKGADGPTPFAPSIQDIKTCHSGQQEAAVLSRPELSGWVASTDILVSLLALLPTTRSPWPMMPDSPR